MLDNNNIVIVTGIDTNYVPHLAVMLQSMASSNPDPTFRVFVLHDGIPVESRNKLQHFKNISLEWIQIDDGRLLDRDGIYHITRATYLRLNMSEVLPRYIDRVLYLDVDLVIDGDIRPLWNTALGANICAAVVDPGVDPEGFARKWGLEGRDLYFNAGVVLFDLKALRQGAYLEKATQVLDDPVRKVELADQDAQNVVLWNKWLHLDPHWNFQRIFMADNCRHWKTHSNLQTRPAIVHFTQTNKPWHAWDRHPCKWLYLRTLLQTPFRAEVLHKGKYTPLLLVKSWLKWVIQRPSMFR